MEPGPIRKNLLSALVIAAGGFVLFYLAFLLAAFVENAAMNALEMAPDKVPPSPADCYTCS